MDHELSIGVFFGVVVDDDVPGNRTKGASMLLQNCLSNGHRVLVSLHFLSVSPGKILTWRMMRIYQVTVICTLLKRSRIKWVMLGPPNLDKVFQLCWFFKSGLEKLKLIIWDNFERSCGCWVDHINQQWKPWSAGFPLDICPNDERQRGREIETNFSPQLWRIESCNSAKAAKIQKDGSKKSVWQINCESLLASWKHVHLSDSQLLLLFVGIIFSLCTCTSTTKTW